MEKQVSYAATNSYETLNVLSTKTKKVWWVLHGIGYLGRYFITYFDSLNADENYIIAPQAPSKYYLKNEYKHVGASWLTKESTAQETNNVIAYLEAVRAQENIPVGVDQLLLGYSQGVSVAARWLARRQFKCSHLVLYAGSLPAELSAENFMFLAIGDTKITFLVGNNDQYLNESTLAKELDKLNLLFGGKAEVLVFEGGHEFKKELLYQFAR